MTRVECQDNGPAAAVDAGKARHRPGHGEEGEDVIDAARIGPCRHHARGEQRLDLRGEQQPVARLLPGPVERADAEAIAGQQ